jgi:anti-sigma regulatory factor (Ser/Thr protein kinase)
VIIEAKFDGKEIVMIVSDEGKGFNPPASFTTEKKEGIFINEGSNHEPDLMSFHDSEIRPALKDSSRGEGASEMEQDRLNFEELKSHGRGLKLIAYFMDRVSFYNGGTTIELRKRVVS